MRNSIRSFPQLWEVKISIHLFYCPSDLRRLKAQLKSTTAIASHIPAQKIITPHPLIVAFDA
jgi:hypothetical protein